MHKQESLTDYDVGYPSWSRDGQWIYLRGGGTVHEAWCRIRLRDRKLERIANLNDVAALAAPPGRGPTQISTSWWAGLAPDGSLLTTREAGNLEIYSMSWSEK